MPKINEEQRIMQYFETANLDKAEAILELCRYRLKQRRKVDQATEKDVLEHGKSDVS